MQATPSHSPSTIKSIAGNLSITDAKQIRIDLCAACTMRLLLQLSNSLFAGVATRTPNMAEINSFSNGFSCHSKESFSQGMLFGLRFKCGDSKPVDRDASASPQMSPESKATESQYFQFRASKCEASDLSAPAFCARLPRKLSAFS